MTTEFRQRFNIDPRVSDLAASERTKQIFGIIFGIAALIGSVVLGDVQKDYWYDKSTRDILDILKIVCVIVGLLEVIMSPIILILNAKGNSKRQQTHVIVYDDKVTGISYNDPSFGRPFELSYADITRAVALPTNRTGNGNNIRIETTSGYHLCYAIEQNAAVVNLINEKKAAFDAGTHTSATSQNASRYCPFCGTALPAGSSFCCKCGKSQNV